MLYDLKTTDGTVLRTQNFDGDPPTLAPEKGFSWVEHVPVPPDPETEEQYRARKKRERDEAVSNIAVTVTSGKVFDGDETSQGRMSRAIIGMQAASVSEIGWTLANNEHVTVTIAELTEALILAGLAQSALWEIPPFEPVTRAFGAPLASVSGAKPGAASSLPRIKPTRTVESQGWLDRLRAWFSKLFSG
jgi:hypothetical protein